MAYGLDFEEIYYTDHSGVDLGVLQTYEIDIDLADEKDFQIDSPEPVIPVKGYWYIQGTEFGGIADGFETDSDEEKVTYTGRTFRGILNSHYVDVEGEERILPSSYTGSDPATISDCYRELIAEHRLGSLFVVDDPDVHESVSAQLSFYVVKRGTTLYDAMMGAAQSIDFSFRLEYRSDHKVHIIPILVQDYTDYLKGSKYEGIGFQTEITAAVTNHIICAITSENEGVRNIHLFADDNGGVQPYAIVDNPIKDSQYILDKRNQVLFGVDEIQKYMESSSSAVENYELVTAQPPDWVTNFGNYYHHTIATSAEEYFIVPNAGSYAIVLKVEPVAGTTIGVATNDGETFNFSAHTAAEYQNILSFDGSKTFTFAAAYIQEHGGSLSVTVSYEDDDESTDVESEDSFDAYEAEGKERYIQVTNQPDDWDENYSSYYTRSYNQDEDPDDPEDDWKYTPYSATSELDTSSATKIAEKDLPPSDWKTNYGEYYYRVQTGTGYEYRPYESVSVDVFVRMTAEPTDWDTNFGSYYRKLFKKEFGKKGKKNNVPLVDYVKKGGEYYTTCKKDDDKKNGKIPSFSKRAHYRKDTVQRAPECKKNNCYRVRTITVKPKFQSTNCWSMKMEYHPPQYVDGKVYRMVLDHYASAVESAIDELKEEQKKSSQTMSLEDFPVNIGDIVGGTDHFTGTSIVGGITNIEATIENGLIDVSYSVTVDDYTTKIDINRLPTEG